MSLASKTEGRIISLGFHVSLTPPDAPIGETDGATEIGRTLISETMRYLKQAAEKEGFIVEIYATNVVY